MKTGGLKCVAVLRTLTREKLKTADIVVSSATKITPSLARKVTN